MSGHRVPISATSNSFYAATKFAVTALVEGIRQELREKKSNCRVTVRDAQVIVSILLLAFLFQGISPGLVRTEFIGRAFKRENMEKAIKEYDTYTYNVSQKR